MRTNIDCFGVKNEFFFPFSFSVCTFCKEFVGRKQLQFARSQQSWSHWIDDDIHMFIAHRLKLFHRHLNSHSHYGFHNTASIIQNMQWDWSFSSTCPHQDEKRHGVPSGSDKCVYPSFLDSARIVNLVERWSDWVSVNWIPRNAKKRSALSATPNRDDCVKGVKLLEYLCIERKRC